MNAHSARRFTAFVPLLAVGLALPSTAIARGQKHALIVHGRDQGFNREAEAFVAAAQTRGYETSTFNVWTLASRDAVLAKIDSDTASLGPGDRLLLTFNCHGMDVPGNVYFDPEDVRGHMTCRVSSDDIRDVVKRLVQRSVEVVVFDNSCSGGATVELLEPLHVCAIASVAPGLPSVVGLPRFSSVFRDGNLTRTFEDVAIEGQFEILHRIPARIGQKGYYSTQSELAQGEALFRSAFSYAANSLSEFQLRGTALHGALRGDDEEEGRARPRTIDQVLKRSTHYSEVLDRVMATVSSRWATSNGKSEQTQAYQRATSMYQKEGLLSPDLRVPATVNELHDRIRAEVDSVQQKRARLATLVDAWQQHGGGGEDAIRELQQDILQQDANVSVLMGLSELVDTTLDDSPCRIGI